MSYFNTTEQVGELLAQYQHKAISQEQAILKYFEARHDQRVLLISPSEIQKQLFDRSIPITSVRRAMTNLTNDGRLRKTDKQRDGMYGRPEYCWSLETQQRELL